MAKRMMSNIEIMDAIKFTDGNFKKKKLPIKLSYAIRRSVTNLQQAYKPYEDSLIELCTNYDVTPDNMNIVVDDPDKSKEENEAATKAKKKEFNKDVQDLLNEKTEIDVQTVDISLLEKCEDNDQYDELSYEDINSLWWIIDDSEDNNKEKEG